jgi:hypothetical protein
MTPTNRHFELIERTEKPWQTGVPIKFGSMSELNDYEDVIRDATDLGNALRQDVFANWDGRQKLKDIVRIRKFNGRLLNIQLVPLETDPDVYTILETQSFVGGGKKTLDDTKNTPECVNGFEFSADAHSTGRGIIGAIHSYLIYAPLSTSRGDVDYKRPSRNLHAHPIGLRRFISIPTIVTITTPEEIKAESAEIAFKDKRYALRRPFGA